MPNLKIFPQSALALAAPAATAPSYKAWGGYEVREEQIILHEIGEVVPGNKGNMTTDLEWWRWQNIHRSWDDSSTAIHRKNGPSRLTGSRFDRRRRKGITWACQEAKQNRNPSQQHFLSQSCHRVPMKYIEIVWKQKWFVRKLFSCVFHKTESFGSIRMTIKWLEWLQLASFLFALSTSRQETMSKNELKFLILKSCLLCRFGCSCCSCRRGCENNNKTQTKISAWK